jgi:hypothetical protein
MVSEFINEGGGGFGCHVHVANIIDKDAGSTFAGTQTFSEFDGELAIRSGVAGVYTVAVADGFEQFFAATQGAGDAAAEPDAMFSEWVIFFLEEVVEGHRVVNFGRMEFEQFSDFNDGFAGDSAEGVVDEVQSGQGNSAFIGVFREFRFDFLTEFFRESAHGLPAGMW